MRKRHETVELYVSQAQGHQATGDYRSALKSARNALSAIEREPVSFEMEARVLLLAARNAYYLSGFDECSIYLDMLGELIRFIKVDAGCERYEASVIRANILRRHGEYRAALDELSDIDGSVENCLAGSLAGEKYLIEGACHYFLKDTRRAKEILETALGLTAGVSSWKLRARVLTMMGLVLRRLGFMRKAADDLRRAAAACSKNNDEYGLAAALLNLGITQYHVGDIEAAERSVIKASSLFERINWQIGMCRCLIALGNMASMREALDEALELYSEASRLAKEQAYQRELAQSLSGIASIHTVRHDFTSARNCLVKAQMIASEIAPDGDLAAEVTRKIGELEILEGNIHKAMYRLEESEGMAKGQDAPLELGLVYRAMGRAETDRGNLDTGKILFERSRDLIRKSGSTYELARTCLKYAETLISSNRTRLSSCIPGKKRTEEPWSLLWEARHLFTGMNVQHMVDRVDFLLGREERSNTTSLMVDVDDAVTGSGLIEISFVHDYKVCDGLVAVSPIMQDVWDRIQFAASYKGPVLVTGETGTGKELVAKLIHNSSARAPGPFVAVNCAAIPDHLFESEFFGHRKGSFTGAVIDRRGFFEEASGGTLFLDEVGELTTLHQAKLLRVLQEGKIRRLGENSEHEVDIKLVSATNQDLGSKLDDSSLREDFFFRINSERIHIPPLRDRREDIIPLLSWRLCGNGNGTNGRTVQVDSDVVSIFQKYHWPGNVRELISITDRLSCLANDSPITINMLPDRMRGDSTLRPDWNSQQPGDCSRRRLESAMSLCRGNKSAAARWLGISRGKLYKELKKTGLYRYYHRTT